MPLHSMDRLVVLERAEAGLTEGMTHHGYWIIDYEFCTTDEQREHGHKACERAVAAMRSRGLHCEYGGRLRLVHNKYTIVGWPKSSNDVLVMQLQDELETRGFAQDQEHEHVLIFRPRT